jgi:hypothetical protein
MQHGGIVAKVRFAAMECEPVSNGASTRGGACVTEDSPSGMLRASFCVGEVSLGLTGDDNVPQRLSRQIEPFRLESEICTIEISLAWAEIISLPSDNLVFDSGSVWKLYDDPPRFLFDFSSPTLGTQPYKRLFIDRDFRRGRILLNRSCFPDPAKCNPLEYPLDELVVMHRLGRERGVEVHAAGMQDAEGNGYLFLGHSGAGKSTTTRLWNQQHSMTVLSDDRIILRETAGPRGQSEVWMHGTPWHGEAAFAAPGKARIERLFILEHAPENRISLVTRGRAVAEIMARSFLPFYDAAALDNTMRFLEEIVAAIPCYRLEFCPDQAAVEVVRRFRD